MRRPSKRAPVWYYDIETTEWVNFCLGCCYCPETEEVHFFKTAAKMVDFMTGNRGVYWAHNGGGFDVKILLPHLLEKGLLRSARVVGGKFFEVHAGGATFRDTLFLLKESLGALAPKFGLKKLEMDYEEISARSGKTREYLENDCRILAQIHKAVTEYLGFDRPPGTIGGAAVRMWLGKDRPPWAQEYKPHGRKAYYGGRCEIFRLWGEKVTVFDLNSLYPYIMQRDSFPIGPYHFENSVTAATAVAGVTVRIPRDAYVPPLPWLRDRLYFPTGEFFTTLARPELELAAPYIQRVQWALRSDNWAPVFRPWVQARWNKRKAAQEAGDAVGATLEKWLMNNLSGKICEGEEKSRLVVTDEVREGDEPVDVDYDVFMRTYWANVPHSQPVVGAQITSAARVELYHWLCAAGSLGKLYYTATDSVHCEAELPTGKELGEMKCEAREKPATYLQCGVYQIGNKARVRGYTTLPGKDALTPQGIYERLEKKAAVQLDSFSGAMTCLTSHEFTLTRGKEKCLRSSYNKRCQVETSGDTRPWTAAEIRDGAHVQKKDGQGDLIGASRAEILDVLNTEGGLRPYKKIAGRELEAEENRPLKRKGLMTLGGAQTLDMMAETVNSYCGTGFSADELREFLLDSGK